MQDPGGIATIAITTACAVIAVAFFWLRAVLPSEPADVPSDDWPWSSSGVVVQALDEGPFVTGDLVVAIDGQSLESWATSATSLGALHRPDLSETLTFDVVRGGRRVEFTVALRSQSILERLGAGVGLLVFTMLELLLALFAWLGRPAEGWRRGFLVGSVANLASALLWELGLQLTDLVRPEPTFVLFSLAGPLHLLFWSSVAHVIGSFPTRHDLFARRPLLVVGLYLVPQVVLVAAVGAARLTLPSTLEWIGSWSKIVAAVALPVICLNVPAAVRAYRLFEPDLRPRLRLLLVTIVATTLAVVGLTILPILVTGRPIASRPAVAVLAIPAIAALAAAVVRYRLFEIALLDTSRRRLVVAREEERRRLRRDLHDGLGPMLASMTLKIDVARDQVRSDPERAEETLDTLKSDARMSVAEVRRLVRELRPPSLDELGLVDALRQRALEFCVAPDSQRSPLEMVVETDGPIPPLSAAVEVAAYRIATEAMTNVVRHAAANRCRVRISAHRHLKLEILDDGVGVDADRPAGVGFSAMRERAAEIGGRWTIDRRDGWTCVLAELPLTV